MRIAVTGSSGLIGGALCAALNTAGHQVVRVVRHTPLAGEIGWDPDAGTVDSSGFDGVDAVVHLAGAGIADERWTDERKRQILESRTDGTDLLSRTLAGLDRRPAVLLSGSAIGYYGDRGDEVLTEESEPGDGFLSRVCQAWEAATAPAEDAGIRTCHLRTGIVQSADGGALAKTLLPFKLGIGGRLGSGQQWWSWISIDDQVRAIMHLLGADVSGAVNLTAPVPVRNIEFTKALGRELARPTVLPIPSIGPRLLLGKELAQILLYESQRVAPTVLEHSGYAFRHRTIDDCFASVLGDTELA